MCTPELALLLQENLPLHSDTSFLGPFPCYPISSCSLEAQALEIYTVFSPAFNLALTSIFNTPMHLLKFLPSQKQANQQNAPLLKNPLLKCQWPRGLSRSEWSLPSPCLLPASAAPAPHLRMLFWSCTCLEFPVHSRLFLACQLLSMQMAFSATAFLSYPLSWFSCFFF